MPNVTYSQAETDALAHFAAQTAFGSPPPGAPDSSLIRAVEEVRALAGILTKHKAAIELAPRTTDIAEMYQPLHADLTALSALSGTGFVERTGDGAYTTRTLSAGDIPNLSASYVTPGALTAALDDLADVYQPIGSYQAALDFTPENAANKNVANGYAGLSAGSKISAAQMTEVLAVTELTTYASLSGTGSAAIAATITTPALNDVLTWNGTNWINQAPSGGSALPVADTTAIVKGSVDATKQVRMEVDGLTTATTRVITVPDADFTLAGIDIGNTFSAVQTFAANYTSFGGSLFRGINGNGLFEMMNNAGATPEGLVLGAAANASSVRLKPSSAVLQIKLSDDSGWARCAAKELAVTNSASATTPGSVVKKIEVFDAATGASLGFLPVYSAIT